MNHLFQLKKLINSYNENCILINQKIKSKKKLVLNIIIDSRNET